MTSEESKYINKAKQIFAEAVDKERDLSLNFLRKCGSKIRLVAMEPNVLEFYLISKAFSNLSEQVLFIVGSDAYNTGSVSIREATYDAIIQFQSDRFSHWSIIADSECQNFCFFHEADEYFILCGKENFLLDAQPCPVDISKLYYQQLIGESLDIADYQHLMKKYEKFIE